MEDSKRTLPFTEARPWGEFRLFTKDIPVSVKTIHIRKGERISLQYHSKRTEFLRVLAGNPLVTVGEEVFEAKEGDEFTVPPMTRHRYAAIDTDVTFLEISTGEVDEADVIRLEDDYGRVPSKFESS